MPDPSTASALHTWRTPPLGVMVIVIPKLFGLSLWFHGQHGLGLLVFFAPAPWILYQVFVPSAAGLGPIATRFVTAEPEVWLTIDDGPHPDSTPALLELLDQHEARATFFLVGENVHRYPELVAETVRRGHTVGNHTHTHPVGTFWCAGAHRTATELDDCSAALRSAGALSPRFFRAPVGFKNLFLHRELARRGLLLIGWSARGYDCRRTPQAATRAVLAKVRPGSIILLHDRAHPDSLLTVEQVLTSLTLRGYRCVLPKLTSLSPAASSKSA